MQNLFRGFWSSMSEDIIRDPDGVTSIVMAGLVAFVVAGLYGTLFGWGAWWR